MKEPVWISLRAVLQMHYEQIAEHGGSPIVRDQGLLESALARPQNIFVYEQGTIERLAAAYASGVVRNHPFVDGNKRTSFVVMGMFLGRNGFDLRTTEVDAASTFLAFAAGELSDDDVAQWIKDHIVPRHLL